MFAFFLDLQKEQIKLLNEIKVEATTLDLSPTAAAKPNSSEELRKPGPARKRKRGKTVFAPRKRTKSQTKPCPKSKTKLDLIEKPKEEAVETYDDIGDIDSSPGSSRHPSRSSSTSRSFTPSRPCPKSKSGLDLIENPTPPEVISIKLEHSSSENATIHFCLDCEGCKSRHCTHENHARKIIKRPNEHILNYNHGRFQKEADFLNLKPKLQIEDLAYNPANGAKVRKLYKKYAAENEGSSPVSLFDYPINEMRKCKKCDFQTPSIVYMFRHIREVHMDKDAGSTTE
jgi:hypothetical protein